MTQHPTNETHTQLHLARLARRKAARHVRAEKRRLAERTASLVVVPENSWEIPGFDGNYRITKHGDVWSRISNRRKGKTIGRWKLREPILHPLGYLCLTMKKNDAFVNYKIHRLVAMTLVPGNQSLSVNHIDMNKLNNHPHNLEWISREENTRKAIAVLGTPVPRRPVTAVHQSTQKRLKFPSHTHAAKELGVRQGHIGRTISNGYLLKGWSFQNA